MPTLAKLIAAIAFAAVGALAAVAFIPLLPEGTQTGWLVQICAGLGLVFGWMVMGVNVGRSYAEAAATGIRTSIMLTVFALLCFAVYVMLTRSTRMMYDGPMQALLAVFAIMLEYGKLMWDKNFLSVLAAGGILGGVLTEFTGRRSS
jgi:hypothetical protein